MRNQAFEKQRENILATIGAQRADLDFMVENTKKLQERIVGLEGKTLEEHQEKERLLAEKRFNEKLSSVQHFFQPQRS